MVAHHASFLDSDTPLSLSLSLWHRQTHIPHTLFLVNTYHTHASTLSRSSFFLSSFIYLFFVYLFVCLSLSISDLPMSSFKSSKYENYVLVTRSKKYLFLSMSGSLFVFQCVCYSLCYTLQLSFSVCLSFCASLSLSLSLSLPNTLSLSNTHTLSLSLLPHSLPVPLFLSLSFG